MTGIPAEDPSADRPNIARVYDYLLGGSHNFAPDRTFAQELLSQWPEARDTMRVNRAFLGRAVRYLAQQAGIRQFLDIGSGIPTMGNVHEIAQQTAPGTHVVYVDFDPVAVLHSRAILAGNPAAAIEGDLRQPRQLLEHPELSAMLDLSKPVALLLVAVLHFFRDADQSADLVAELREALAPGRYLVITHGTADGYLRHVTSAMETYSQATAPFQLRSHAEILRFFHGFNLLAPGLVRIPLWRPDDPPEADAPANQIAGYAGVGLKP